MARSAYWLTSVDGQGARVGPRRGDRHGWAVTRRWTTLPPIRRRWRPTGPPSLPDRARQSRTEVEGRPMERSDRLSSAPSPQAASSAVGRVAGDPADEPALVGRAALAGLGTIRPDCWEIRGWRWTRPLAANRFRASYPVRACKSAAHWPSRRSRRSAREIRRSE